MLRFLLIVAITASVAVPAGIWLDGRLREGRRQADAEFEQRVEQALSQMISLEELAGGDQKIMDVLRHIARQTDLPLAFDWGKMPDAAEIEKTLVSIPDTRLTLRSALNMLSRQASFGYYPAHGRLVITSFNDARNRLITRVYPLANLIGPEQTLAPTPSQWMDLLTDVISPESWDTRGEERQITPIPSAFVIRHSRQAHHRLERFFQRLEGRSSLPDARADFHAMLSPAEQRIVAALEVPCDYQCTSAPLYEVLEDLAWKFHVPIVIRQQALQAVSINTQKRLTLKMDGARLSSILQSLLDQMGLAFVIADDLVQVSTRDEVESQLRTVVYDVRDLVTQSGADYGPLAELIESSIPAPWQRIQINFAPLPPGYLAIQHLDGTHAEIAELLTRMRSARSLAGAERPPAVLQTVAEQHLAESLQHNIRLGYHHISLAEVAADLEERTGAHVQLDEWRIADLDGKITLTVDCDLPPLPLYVALDQMLQQKTLAAAKLAWTIRNESLVLTTTAAVKEDRELTVLDVRGLVDPGDADSFTEWNLLELIKQIGPFEQWDGNWVACYRGTLVAAARRVAGQELQRFVNVLRRFHSEALAQRQRGNISIESWEVEFREDGADLSRNRVKIYPALDLLAGDIPAIQDLQRAGDFVLDEDWDWSHKAIPIPPGGLLVEASPESHQKFQAFLDELRQHLLPGRPVAPWLLSRDKQRQALALLLSSREPVLSGVTKIPELREVLTRVLKREIVLHPIYLDEDLQDLSSPSGPHLATPTILEQLSSVDLALIETERGLELTNVVADDGLAFLNVSDLQSPPQRYNHAELSAIFYVGQENVVSGYSWKEPFLFRGHLVLRSHQRQLARLGRLLTWIRSQPQAGRAARLYHQGDSEEADRLISQLLSSQSDEERLYLAFLLQFVKPPEVGLENLALHADGLFQEWRGSLLAQRLREVLHRWVELLPHNQLELLAAKSPSALLRSGAIQSLSSQTIHAQGQLPPGVEALLRLAAEPDISAADVRKIEFALELRRAPITHPSQFDKELAYQRDSVARIGPPIFRSVPWRMETKDQ